MKVTKTITLQIERQGNNFIVYDLISLNMLLGGSSISANLHMYKGCIKEKGRWIIPMDAVKERIAFLEREKYGYEQRIDIMQQLIKQEKQENGGK